MGLCVGKISTGCVDWIFGVKFGQSLGVYLSPLDLIAAGPPLRFIILIGSSIDVDGNQSPVRTALVTSWHTVTSWFREGWIFPQDTSCFDTARASPLGLHAYYLPIFTQRPFFPELLFPFPRIRWTPVLLVCVLRSLLHTDHRPLFPSYDFFAFSRPRIVGH